MKTHQLFGLLLVLGGLTKPAQAQTAAPRPKTLLVHGMATQELEPEKAEVLLTYRVSDNVKEADKAREQQAQLLAVLRAYSIAPEKLTVYNLTASGSGGYAKVTNSSMALTKQYKLLVDKPALLDELIPKLVQSGADNVVVSNLESSRLEAFRLEVMSKALADARAKAQHIARQVGAPLGKVYSVVEVWPNGQPNAEPQAFYYKSMAARGYQDAPENISMRTIRVVAVFDVEYELP